MLNSTSNFHVDLLPESNLVKALDLAVNGNLINAVKWSKDLAVYNYNLKSISISYEGSQKNDLKIETSAKSTLASVVFLKRGQLLYLIFVSQADPTKKMEPINMKNILRNDIEK